MAIVTLIPSIILTLSIALLWLPSRRQFVIAKYAWLGTFLVALLAALHMGQLDWPAILPISLLGVVCYMYPASRGYGRLLLAISLIVLSLGLGLHVFPGFHNPLIVDHVRLAPDSLAYSMRFNLDKPVIGLFILAWNHPLIGRFDDIYKMLRRMLPWGLLTVGGVVALALLSGFIRVDFKLPHFLVYWVWGNLFFTCVVEEALFRGFIQRQLGLSLSSYRNAPILALVVAAILFGLAHAAGGVTYVLLAMFAGLGYGFVYQQTGRIEASILLHFILNFVQIVFFSYPALA